mmetsp:Transcript_41100/g.88701  ORF Transcript_41100/g.88701 Transcript_41100/m.88701 type:complete len:248 (+) Transcript_41100:531-1274(+)
MVAFGLLQTESQRAAVVEKSGVVCRPVAPSSEGADGRSGRGRSAERQDGSGPPPSHALRALHLIWAGRRCSRRCCCCGRGCPCHRRGRGPACARRATGQFGTSDSTPRGDAAGGVVVLFLCSGYGCVPLLLGDVVVPAAHPSWLIHQATRQQHPDQHTEGVQVSCKVVPSSVQNLRGDVARASGGHPEGPSARGGFAAEAAKAKICEFGDEVAIEDDVVRFQISQQRVHAAVHVLKTEKYLRDPILR